MPEFTGNKADVVNRGIQTLTETSPVRQFNIGSKGRSVVETYAPEVQNLARLMDSHEEQCLFPTSSGRALSQWGVTSGVQRYESRNASVTAEDRIIRFSVSNGGTFGSINGGNSIVLPAGTYLTSPADVARELDAAYIGVNSPDSIRDRAIHFSLTTELVCASDKTEAWASARALTPGSDGNLTSPRMIRSHSYTDYSDYLNKSLVVTNVKPILNGSNPEGPDSYKYRISKAMTSAEKANLTALREAALKVGGVADVVIVPYEEGPGNVAIYIKGTSSIISDSTINEVQQACELVVAEGCYPIARRPYQVGIEIVSNLQYREDYKADIKAQIRQNLAVAAQLYINSLDLGPILSFDSMARSLRESDSRITAVGSNPTTKFDSVYAWFPARLASGGRRRERLIVPQFSVPMTARVVAEISLTTPVEFL